MTLNFPIADETPAAPPMGVETALKNIGVTKFFRSSSEVRLAGGDLDPVSVMPALN